MVNKRRRFTKEDAVQLAVFAMLVISVMVVAQTCGESAHGQVSPQWISIDRFGGVNTNLPPLALNIDQCRKAVGWTLDAGVLTRQTFDKRGATNTSFGAYIIGQSRSDTSILYFSDDLKRLHVPTGTEYDVTLTDATVNYDSLYTESWYTDVTSSAVTYGVAVSYEFINGFSLDSIQHPRWLWYAPTDRRLFNIEGEPEPVVTFLSNKYIRFQATAMDKDIDTDTLVGQGNNFYVDPANGIGSFEYTGVGSATNRDTTIILDGTNLWHYAAGAITDQFVSYATPPNYYGDGVAAEIEEYTDTLYIKVDTSQTFQYMNPATEALVTDTTSLGDPAEDVVGSFIIWDDTSALGLAVPCEILAVYDSTGGYKLLKVLADSALYVGRNAYRDSCDFIIIKNGTTNDTGWVPQGRWANDYTGTDSTVLTHGPATYQNIVAYAGVGVNIYDSAQWPELTAELYHMTAGEIWRVREESQVQDTIYPTDDSTQGGLRSGCTDYFDCVDQPDPVDCDSSHLTTFLQLKSGDEVSFEFAAGDTIDASYKLDSLKVHFYADWGQGLFFTPYLRFAGKRELSKTLIKGGFGTRLGCVNEYITPAVTGIDGDSLQQANACFGISASQSAYHKLYNLTVHLYLTDTANTDTAYVVRPRLNAGVGDGTNAILATAMWPRAFDFNDAYNDTLIWERAKHVTSWSTTEKGTLSWSKYKRGMVHRRRAWYCVNDSAPNAFAWSDLNSYDSVRGNAETLEGNDPIVSWSSFGQQAVGGRRRSIFGVTGFAESDFYLQPIPGGTGPASMDVQARSSTHNVDLFSNEEGLWSFDGGRQAKVSPEVVEIFEDSINWDQETKMRAAVFEDRYWLAAPFGSDTNNNRLMVFDVSDLGDVQATFLEPSNVASMWKYTGSEGDEYLFLGTNDSTVIYQVARGEDDFISNADWRSGWLEQDHRLRVLRYEIELETGSSDSVFVDFYVDYSETAKWSDTLEFASGSHRATPRQVPRSVQGDQLSFGIRTPDTGVKVKAFRFEVTGVGERRR